MKKTIINTDNAPAPIGPYHQAVLAGDTLYVSGQIPLNPETKEIVGQDGDIMAEATQVMTNLQAVLKEAGMGFENVVKCTIFMTDINDFATINGVYGSFFKDCTPPARETMEVKKLPKNVNVEISCIAVKLN
ncbi:MAG: RidA family protein [Cytophagales bacterium]|nr:RidA family protein [Cytophagales bacterium]